MNYLLQSSKVLQWKEPHLSRTFSRTLPDDWLQVLITSIYKKSLNYKPISLTCILCKVMEHIMKHLHKHTINLHFQHGFQSGLPCESQLTETVHDWITARYNITLATMHIENNDIFIALSTLMLQPATDVENS